MKEITIIVDDLQTHKKTLEFENEEQYKEFLEEENYWDFETSNTFLDNETYDVRIVVEDETSYDEIDISEFTINFEDLD